MPTTQVLLATNIKDVAERIKEILIANSEQLGLVGVDNSDPRLIPDFPHAAVITRGTVRELNGTRQYRLEFVIDILVQDEEIQEQAPTRKSLEDIADDIDTLFSKENISLDRMVVQGWIARIEYGTLTITDNGERMMRQAVRLQHRSISRQIF